MEDAPTEVWHYTSAAGLKGIIENDYLFASPATQMNDSKELHEGRETAEKVLKRLLVDDPAALKEALSQIGTFDEVFQESENLFLISASTDGDNLSLWRNYGSTASYAIRFDTTKVLRPIVNPGSLSNRLLDDEVPGIMLSYPLPHAAASGSLEWLPVDYNGLRANELAEKIASGIRSVQLREQSAQFIRDYRSRLLARVKHGSFSAETEVRRIIRVSPSHAFLGFRDSPKGLMRHIRVGYSSTDSPGRLQTADGKDLHDCILKPDKLPIQEVKLSPVGHLSSAPGSLASFLQLHGYADVKVSRSASPFIG